MLWICAGGAQSDEGDNYFAVFIFAVDYFACHGFVFESRAGGAQSYEGDRQHQELATTVGKVGLDKMKKKRKEKETNNDHCWHRSTAQMAWGGESPAWSESPGSNPVSLWYNVEPVTPIKDQGSWQYLINRRDTSSRQTLPTRTMGSTSTTGWTIILLTILISGQAQGEQLILQMSLTFGLFQVHQLQNNSRDINLHGGIEKVVIIFPNINIPCQTHVVHRWSWEMSWDVDPHCSKSKADNNVSN